VRPDSLMRCPACRVGSVVTYVRSQMLFVPDLWARCDNCGADFDYHMQTDSLTLSDLPNGPGQLNGDWVGQTRTRTEWAAMAGEDVAGATCPVCGAEFTTCDGGNLQWISRAGDPEGVPPEHRGKCRSRVAWAKVAHHIRADHGTVVCPSCDAQFDESDTAQLTLLSAPRDPHGTLARHRGRTYPAAKWRAMATGRTGTSLAGLVCPSCASELQQTRRQDSYALTWFDGARDPYGTGHRYQNQALSSDDWRRIAAGGVPRAEEQRLRQEIHQEFWAAMRAGEVSTSSAEESFPESRSADEKIVITFPVIQVRSRFGFLYERDGGNVWLTTRRLVYEGDRDTMSLELADTQPARVLDGGQGSPVVEIGTADRRREFRFVMGSGPIAFEVERVTLQLQWDESAFAELFQSLRGRA